MNHFVLLSLAAASLVRGHGYVKFITIDGTTYVQTLRVLLLAKLMNLKGIQDMTRWLIRVTQVSNASNGVSLPKM
jgi:hypothetical protein